MVRTLAALRSRGTTPGQCTKVRGQFGQKGKADTDANQDRRAQDRSLVLGHRPWQLVRIYARTLYLVRYSLITIAGMLAVGFVTRYSGTDATLGLVLANTGWLYPFFGTLIGWLGVALTGSDTASNVLFGGLQRVSAEQLGINATLMAAADVTHTEEGVDPGRDIEVIETELALADLETIERRLPRLEKEATIDRKLLPTVEIFRKLHATVSAGMPG